MVGERTIAPGQSRQDVFDPPKDDAEDLRKLRDDRWSIGVRGEARGHPPHVERGIREVGPYVQPHPDQDSVRVRDLDAFGQDAAEFLPVDLEVVGPSDPRGWCRQLELSESLNDPDGRGQCELRFRLDREAVRRSDRSPG